jgi:hypothetical protein
VAVIPYLKIIRYFQVPPSQVADLRVALLEISLFDTANNTVYSERIIELLDRLELLYTPPSYQPVGTPGLLGLHQHGIKSFADGDFKIEYDGSNSKEMAIASAKSEVWGILRDFGYETQTQGVLQRS